MGGYTGATFFLVMQKNGAVTSLDIGQTNGLETATVTCSNALKKGLLPPAPTVAPSTPVAPVVSPNPAPKFGFRFMMVPQGAYVVALDSGSDAEVSGLKVGSVITSINGISLAGMDQGTVLKILDALQTAKISLIGQGEIQLSRK
jgi:S1-C subfamily serine protease